MIQSDNNPPSDGFTALPPPPLDPTPPDPPRRDPEPPAEIIPPTSVSLRCEGQAPPARPRSVMVALTAGAVWIQDTWQLRHVPLAALAGVEPPTDGNELALTLRPEPSAETLRLTFAGGARARRWYEELEALRQELPPDAPPADRRVPEGVALVKGGPGPDQVVVGRVEFTGQTNATADRGLQLRAALRGADAVVWVERQRLPGQGRHVGGVAVRVEDAGARQQMRRRWYDEEVGDLVKRSLLLLVVQASLLLLVNVLCAGRSPLHEATGERPLEALRSTGTALTLIYAWPLALLALLHVLRRPGLLPAVGLAVLAATTGRGLTLMAAHLLAAVVTGAGLAGKAAWFLLDPVDWAFILIGLALSLRAWRLAADAPHILPRPEADAPPPRKAWARGLVALTAALALAVMAVSGHARYQGSAYLLQPGIDTAREHEALLAFNKGLEYADAQQWAAAEQSWKESLRLWEELTKGPAAPSAYRAGMGRTLYNLGWLCHREGRLDAAQAYFARVAAIGEQRTGDADTDAEYERCLADARRLADGLRADRAGQQLEEKEKLGIHKYEEAQVKADRQGPAEAEPLCAEAVALWEEILPQGTAPDYRRFALARLATACLWLGELRERCGKVPEAEAALRKAIDYGEKAVELAPDRPLPRHNLEVARQALERLHEQGLHAEIDRLCAAERYADAAELWHQRVEEQEELLRSGKDAEAARRRLASRLSLSAWFLAHCPDRRVRDTRLAVKRAGRATELRPEVADHWYTLAMVRYRNGDWRDSLAALEQLKAREGEYDASGWLLLAMNCHQLKQRDEARRAFRKAQEWIDERKRQAEGNAALRLQYEAVREAIEALRREAEELLEGKDPGGRRLG